MPLRTLAGAAAGVALTAFALGAARLAPAAPEDEVSVQPARAGATPPARKRPEVAEPPRAEPSRPRAGGTRPAPTPAVARGKAAKAKPVPATLRKAAAAAPPDRRSGEAHRARVAAGVLARAASLRAQGREAACAVPEEAGPAAQGAGAIESIEIDWNAGPQDP